MSDFKFELDHIGIAVPSLDESSSFYKALGLKETSREEVSSEKVRVGFYPLENAANLELIEGLGEDSPISKFIDKKGPGIHHICLRVQNLDALVAQLKSQGVGLIGEEPKRGAHNCRIIFVHPKSTGGVLVELSESGGPL